MTTTDTIRLLFHLRNSPDLKLRATVRSLIRSDIRLARGRSAVECIEMATRVSPRVNTARVRLHRLTSQRERPAWTSR